MMVRIVISVVFFLVTSVRADFKYYEEPDPKLYLVDIGPLPSCDYIIDTPAKWSNINSTRYRVFCVAPGDYSSLGTIRINSSGTAAAKRWLRYYDPTGQVPDSTHPYHMPDPKRARVNALRFSGANHWIVDRIYVKPTSTYQNWNSYVIPTSGSSHNVFSRLFITGFSNGIELRNASNYNVIQHTVASNMTHGSDGVFVLSNGIGLSAAAQPKYNRVVSNECFDVNDCLSLVGRDPDDSAYAEEENYEGTIFYNNDLYLTSASYTNCSGTSTPNGDCACKENAVDIKSGGTSANPVIFAHNRMWGWRPLDQSSTCTGPSGSSKMVATAILHHIVENVRVEGNMAWDGGGISLTGKRAINIDIKNNLLHSLFDATSISNVAGAGLHVTAGKQSNVELSNNVFSTIGPRWGIRSIAFFGSASHSEPTVTFSNNVFIKSRNFSTTSSTFAGTVSGNKYYSSGKPSWDTNPAANTESVVGSGWEGKFCTKIKRITAPETKCLPNASSSTGGSAPIAAPGGLRALK